MIGAGGRTRTPDLLITNQLLYQLSYTSTFSCLVIISYHEIFVNSFFEFTKIHNLPTASNTMDEVVLTEISIVRFKLFKKLMIVYSLNVADWICTVVLLYTERFYEANPLMRQIITDLPQGFIFKCLFPALIILTIILALRLLDMRELAVADRFISFVLVFYLAINIDHVINFFILLF